MYTLRRVNVEFNPAKDADNRRKHGISLERAAEFDIGSADVDLDSRRNYGEVRFNSPGYLDDVLYSLTFTLRASRVRAISLRPANRKERRVYASRREQAAGE